MEKTNISSLELNNLFRKKEITYGKNFSDVSLENLMLTLGIICLCLCCIVFAVCGCIKGQVTEEEKDLMEVARRRGKNIDIQEIRRRSMIDYSHEGTTVMAGDIFIA